MTVRIEHVNITVTNPERSAALMERLFGWHVRWEGPARDGGRTIHVGTDDHYLALYTPPAAAQSWPKGQPLNHVGVEVEDIDATEARAIAAGLKPFNHGSYGPGNRHFYLFDHDGIEFEILTYRG